MLHTAFVILVVALLGFVIGFSKGGFTALGAVLTPLLSLVLPNVALAVGVLLPMLLVLGLAYLHLIFKPSIEEVADASRYTAVLNDLGYPTPPSLNVPTLGHFPSSIPATASNVRFFYRPHFLQGGTQLQLRVNLPA